MEGRIKKKEVDVGILIFRKLVLDGWSSVCLKVRTRQYKIHIGFSNLYSTDTVRKESLRFIKHIFT